MVESPQSTALSIRLFIFLGMAYVMWAAHRNWR